MKIFLIYFLLLLPLCISSSSAGYKEVSSLIEVFNILKDPKRITCQFSRDIDPLKFLVKYCEDDLFRCLDEVSKFENIPFERLFFHVISYKTSSYHIPLNYDSLRLGRAIGWIGYDIRNLVPRIFFKPYNSEEELAKMISTIRVLIKISNRYIAHPNLTFPETLEMLSSNVEIGSLLLNFSQQSLQTELSITFGFFRFLNGFLDQMVIFFQNLIRVITIIISFLPPFSITWLEREVLKFLILYIPIYPFW
jgi:hypothetical protein